jgi:hypothetical protein
MKKTCSSALDTNTIAIIKHNPSPSNKHKSTSSHRPPSISSTPPHSKLKIRVRVWRTVCCWPTRWRSSAHKTSTQTTSCSKEGSHNWLARCSSLSINLTSVIKLRSSLWRSKQDRSLSSRQGSIAESLNVISRLILKPRWGCRLAKIVQRFSLWVLRCKVWGRSSKNSSHSSTKWIRRSWRSIRNRLSSIVSKMCSSREFVSSRRHCSLLSNFTDKF